MNIQLALAAPCVAMPRELAITMCYHPCTRICFAAHPTNTTLLPLSPRSSKTALCVAVHCSLRLAPLHVGLSLCELLVLHGLQHLLSYQEAGRVVAQWGQLSHVGSLSPAFSIASTSAILAGRPSPEQRETQEGHRGNNSEAQSGKKTRTQTDRNEEECDSKNTHIQRERHNNQKKKKKRR